MSPIFHKWSFFCLLVHKCHRFQINGLSVLSLKWHRFLVNGHLVSLLLHNCHRLLINGGGRSVAEHTPLQLSVHSLPSELPCTLPCGLLNFCPHTKVVRHTTKKRSRFFVDTSYYFCSTTSDKKTAKSSTTSDKKTA